MGTLSMAAAPSALAMLAAVPGHAAVVGLAANLCRMKLLRLVISLWQSVAPWTLSPLARSLFKFHVQLSTVCIALFSLSRLLIIQMYFQLQRSKASSQSSKQQSKRQLEQVLQHTCYVTDRAPAGDQQSFQLAWVRLTVHTS